MKRPALTIVSALALAACVSATSGQAAACGEEIAPFVDYRVEGVSKAEQALKEGKNVAAAGAILRMFPEIRTIKIAKDGLLDRAARTLALATARSGGALPIDREVPASIAGTYAGKTAVDRQANLDWAASALRRTSEHRKNDPAVETDLGEALSKLDGHHEEALKLLGDLAEKDLVASPEGYAALARLRKDAGDSAGSDAAFKKCEVMTKTASLCTSSGTSTQS
jgi:Flp pilus assembly protein TadD